MRWSDVITLIAAVRADGVQLTANGFPARPREARREVCANKKSVGYSEFLKSYEAGLKADILFDVRSADYDGEKLLEHEGRRYRIYKTYVSKNGEITELKATDLSERGVGDAQDADNHAG